MPPRGSGDGRCETTNACVRWAVTLVEPLVPIRQQARLEASLAEATTADPDFVALVLAGVTSDMVRALPTDDAWRTVVLLHAGGDAERPARPAQTPPDGPGAPTVAQTAPERLPEPLRGSQADLPPLWPDGRSFGAWDDGLDLADNVWGVPETDPFLAALVDGLTPRSARMLIAAFGGWRSAYAEARGILAAPRPDGPQPPHVELTDAVRWGCWRRRAYGPTPTEDVWPYESMYHWVMRANELFVAGKEPDEAEIEQYIGWNRIAEKGADQPKR